VCQVPGLLGAVVMLRSSRGVTVTEVDACRCDSGPTDDITIYQLPVTININMLTVSRLTQTSPTRVQVWLLGDAR
jgi:hypothetical protein